MIWRKVCLIENDYYSPLKQISDIQNTKYHPLPFMNQYMRVFTVTLKEYFAYRILLFTPFPYLYFLPTKIVVDGIQTPYFIQQLICAVGWAGGLFYLANYMWKSGIKEFSFWGR